jgi:hypothetical protein
VLHSTNTFHLASIFLIQNLPLLVLPQRLASIKSLEMVWELPPSAGSSTYQAMVDVVTSAFPTLRKLHISIAHCRCVGDCIEPDPEGRERELLGPMDEMVRKKVGPKLQDCQIALPYCLYTALCDRAQSVGACVESGGTGAMSWRQFWRSVTVEQGGQSENEGYWVRKGMDDTPLMGTSCF